MATPGAEPERNRGVLGVFALGLAVLLAIVALTILDRAARVRIAASDHERRVALLRTALGSVVADNDLLSDVVHVRDPELLGSTDPVPVYRARAGDRPVAVLFEAVAPGGYRGAIRLLIGVGIDGRVLGVRVLSHGETQGLGDAIELRKSKWILSFDGRSLGNPADSGWRVRKDGGEFDQFTGATITPRAVVTAVHDVLLYFSLHRDELLGSARLSTDSKVASPPVP